VIFGMNVLSFFVSFNSLLVVMLAFYGGDALFITGTAMRNLC
jgi:hypothetical protein